MLNNCYRKKEKAGFKNETVQDMNENGKPMFTDPNNDTNKTVQNRELGYIIEKALTAIPFEYRITFSLREINVGNVSETAGLLNISEANGKVRLNRAKAMGRNEIEKSYSASELFEFNLVYCDAIVENVMKKINDI